MRHMLGNLSPNYFERTKRYMMLRASQQGTDLTVSGTPPLSLTNSLGKPLKAWSVDLLPYQEGTGDPSPSNVRAIHGTDKIHIVTSGSRNFLDPSKETTYSGGLGHRWFYADGITLYAGTPYTFSVSGTNQTIALYFVNKADGTPLIPSGNASITYTPDTTVVAYLQAYRGTAILPKNKFQLEVGSTASPYEEFAEPATTSITLPQTVYTGTIGSEGGESRSAIVDLGTLAWSYNATDNVYAAVQGKKIGSQYGRCTALKQVASSTSSVNMPNESYKCYSSSDEIAIELSGITVENASTMLSGMMFEYELATPTAFAVPSVTIPTPTGTATTWATAEDGTVDSMEVTYVGKA